MSGSRHRDEARTIGDRRLQAARRRTARWGNWGNGGCLSRRPSLPPALPHRSTRVAPRLRLHQAPCSRALRQISSPREEGALRKYGLAVHCKCEHSAWEHASVTRQKPDGGRCAAPKCGCETFERWSIGRPPKRPNPWAPIISVAEDSLRRPA